MNIKTELTWEDGSEVKLGDKVIFNGSKDCIGTISEISELNVVVDIDGKPLTVAADTLHLLLKTSEELELELLSKPVQDWMNKTENAPEKVYITKDSVTV